uniref:Uncharacterized protein n=1 Tax=Rhizophora mucronata TaxID=61149 RepID=A0A2P2QUE5_RHIMU
MGYVLNVATLLSARTKFVSNALK